MRQLITVLAASALLAGCATSSTPNYDTRFGEAVRQARQLQTLNPTPSTASMSGMDGVAAAQAAERYVDSFKKPEPVVNVINIGGQIGGGR
ncbi:hypothetical protein PE066_03420 [Ramlibacter tataouinensis]|uniref:hypothetical protein n=1 Tax=Ramlibacter tataouinensis TaxID=94132 RepID=UPI0022F3CBDE|nr:hypothetical protein [Ramlibacter tataouinensis]WBY02600.1 hypothetical protein PE066_03420 [Ramlibacter tataouinensis]